MILVDLNVVLDVVQRREPHFGASAAVLDEIVVGSVRALLPAHAFTTLHYITQRYRGADEADRLVDWLLAHFGVAAVGRAELLRARALGWADFEDGVTAAAGESGGCRQIVTRDVDGFTGFPLPALTPEEYLMSLEAHA